MNKLVEFEALVDAVVERRLSKVKAVERLDDIAKQPNPWGTIILLASFVLVGTGNAAVFDCYWWNILVEILLNLAVGGITLYCTVWIPFLSAFASAIIATALKALIPGLHNVTVILASIMILVPGYSITVATAELAMGTSYAVMGIVHFVNGLFYLLKQVAGAWCGMALVEALVHVPNVETAAIESSWLWTFPLLLGTGLVTCIKPQFDTFLWQS